MSRIYVGNLPLDVKEAELDDLFYKYGRIKDIDIKQPARPPAFAFITFEDYRDAEDAIDGRNGYSFAGSRLRCEMARGDRRGGGGNGRERDGSSGRHDDYRNDRPKKTGGRRTDYGVRVTNLPRSCSWQDLKDFMRKAGDVVYSDVDARGEGVVEFSNRDDMEYAARTLDDTEFKHFNDSTYIRVKLVNKRTDDDRDRGRNASSGHNSPRRSRSRDRKRSYSRSPTPNSEDGDGRRGRRSSTADADPPVKETLEEKPAEPPVEEEA